ncbi:MAG: hypothetical protein OXQ31_05520 [Spirochaetaceae bacterium]|nr:hypothetical protein [Spirochaetaceae bacterium]
MADPMTLRDEDVGRIGEYVKPWLRELVDEVAPRPEPSGADTRLLERMVRVEEEIKAQRTLMDERFGFMATRFEAVDRRFEELIGHTNVRFEELTGQMNTRFGTVDRRFEELIGHTNARFKELIGHTNARFEESHAHTNARFTELAGQMNARFRTQTWMIGVGFAVITSLTTLFALLS